MKDKISAEEAALRGELLGEPYTPPNRPSVFDVPSYDDVADLHELFKRFANTSIAYGGDVVAGVYNFTGSLFVNGRPVGPGGGRYVVDKTTGFTASIQDINVGVIYFCQFTSPQTVTLPTPTGSEVQDGQTISIVSLGKGQITIAGNVVGATLIKTQNTKVDVMWHGGRWWAIASGSGGGGGGEGTPAAPVVAWDPSYDFATWEPVTGTAGPTLGYGVLAIPADLKYTIQNSPPKLIINEAVGGVEYDIEVWGINVAGRGDASNVIAHTWAAINPPSSLSLGVGAGAVTATWSKVSGANAYVVQWSRDQAVWQSAEVGDVSTTVINDLDNVQYWFRVAAKNTPVLSGWSAVQTAIPDPAVIQPIEAAPSAFSKFTITNYNAKYQYTVAGAVGTASIAGNVVTVDDPRGVAILTCSYGASQPKSLRFERRPEGTHTVCQYNQTNWYPHDDPCHQSSDCGCGGCCCGACSSYNPGCGHSDGCGSQRQEPDNWSGEGFTNQYGEWTKIG